MGEKNIKKNVVMSYTAELIKAQFEKRQPLDIPEGIDVDTLIDIAKRGQISYLIAASLLKLNLPKEKNDELAAMVKNSTIKTFVQVMNIKRIRNELENAGVRFQMLKGSIMKNMYPSPEMREMSDIDLMIYGDINKARPIFEELEFELIGDIKHHIVYEKPPYLIVEAHWNLFDENVDKNQFKFYKNDLVVEKKPGCEYEYDFSKEDFYVYLISHMSKHFFETGCGVRNLLDIYVYNKCFAGKLDRSIIEERCNRLGIAEFEKHMEKLSRIWMGDEETSEFYNNLFDYMIDCGIYGKSEYGVFAKLARENKDTSNEMTLKRRYYFPRLSYMEEYYPWLKGKGYLLPIAWVARAFKGIKSEEAWERRKQVASSADPNHQKILDIYNKLNLNFYK